VKTVLTAAVALALLVAVSGCKGKRNPNPHAPENVAEAILRGEIEYEPEEESAGEIDHDQAEEEAAAGEAEQPDAKERKVSSSTYTTTAPGAPDGEHVIIQFQTSYENKQEAVETVTPMMDEGEWRVSGYFIK
jgi:hypothetical protein